MSSIIQVHVKIYIDILYYSIYIYIKRYTINHPFEKVHVLLPPYTRIFSHPACRFCLAGVQGEARCGSMDIELLSIMTQRSQPVEPVPCSLKTIGYFCFFFVSSTIIFPFISGTRNTWHRILVSWLILQNSTETLRRGCKNLLDDTEVGGQLVCSPPIISLLPCLWSESKS